MDLPLPEGPTIAVASPALMLKLASISTGLCSGREVGYLNVTLVKLIARVKDILDEGLLEFRT